MKRVRLGYWGVQLLSRSNHGACVRLRSMQAKCTPSIGLRELQIQAKRDGGMEVEYEDEDAFDDDGEFDFDLGNEEQLIPQKRYPSPLPEAALRSSKLAALHARLGLPKKLPLQTVARTLVDPSADKDTRFNNAALAQVGGPLISYHVAEYLLALYPRLPMSVLFAAAYAYNGPKTLQIIAREWGVETAAAPGDEVDPGLLQFQKVATGEGMKGKIMNREERKRSVQRRGISSRNVYDDEFGDLVSSSQSEVEDPNQYTETAYSNFVKALVGSIYLHTGRASAKTFITSHLLSRHLYLPSLFKFKEPVRELARLCQREDFEYPVARILSETGRFSRTPVFVVGIYSGKEKLGEGSGSNLTEGRTRAAVNSLLSWYMYSPGRGTRVPSEMEDGGTKEWKPLYVDLGEIIH
jgi:dsRNA-specific ribonuclease